MFQGPIVWKGIVYSLVMILGKGLVSSVVYFEYFLKGWRNRKTVSCRREKNTPPQVSNIRPQARRDQETRDRCPHGIALLVGFAMIARGEVGFLIASLSQSSGTLTLRHRDGSDAESSGEDIFLVMTWAIVICTIAGPLGVGLNVRRLRRCRDSHTNWL
jgi:hypothetical protein